MDLYVVTYSIDSDIERINAYLDFETAFKETWQNFVSKMDYRYETKDSLSYDDRGRIFANNKKIANDRQESWDCTINFQTKYFFAGYYLEYDKFHSIKLHSFHFDTPSTKEDFDNFLNQKIHEATEKYKTISGKENISLLEELKISLAVFDYMKKESGCSRITHKINTFLNNVGKDFLAEAKRFYLFNDEFNELPEKFVHEIICECIEKAKQPIINNIRSRLFSESERSKVYYDKEERPYRVCWRQHREESY